MVCCDSISHAEQISRISPRPSWTRSLYGSINVHGRPWDSKLLPIDYEWCCSDQLNPPPESGQIAEMSACPLSATSGCEQMQQGDPYSITSSARARLRHGQAEGLGGLEIDDELEPGRQLDRQLARLGTIEDAIDIGGRTPVAVGEVLAVADQSSGLYVLPEREDRRQPVLERELRDSLALLDEK